jgi:hypothetical protein
MRTDGGEMTGQEDLIEKMAINMNDILIDQIVAVHIEDINLADLHRTS